MSNFWPGLQHRWQTLFKLRQRDMWCQIPKRISSYGTYSERGDPWLPVLVCDFFSTSPLSTWQTPTPRPPSLFQTPLPCECFSPLSILSAPGNSGRCATRPLDLVVPLDLVSRYSAYWLWLQLLLESDCILRAVSISRCNPDQCLAHFFSKCSQLFVVKWSKGIYA